jgi:hypothetical protein
MGIVDDLKMNLTSGSVTVRIILIEAIVFVAMWMVKTFAFVFNLDVFYDFLQHWLAMPPTFFQLLYQPWSLITYAFLHAGIGHIFFNLLFFYWFSVLIEEYLGAKRLINLFVLGAVAGAITYPLMNLGLEIFGRPVVPAILIGSSGAVFAIVVGAATLIPNYEMNLMFIGPVKIKWIALVYVIINIITLGANNAATNLCHLGGALMGYVYVTQLRKGLDLGAPISYLQGLWKNFRQPRPRMTVTRNYDSPSMSQGARFPSEEEVDKILDKISAKGYESLSKEEKQKLFRAGQK